MKLFLVGLVGLFVGMVIGYFGEMVYAAAQFTRTFAFERETELNESGARAFKAYQRESAPVAVYALTQDVATLRMEEEPNAAATQFQMEVERRLTLDHTRLAKLLAVNGATTESANQVALALKCAQKSGRFATITTEAQLTDLVADCDAKGVY